MRRAIKPFLALSTCFWDHSATELCLWCDCATKKITFYTTPVLLLLIVNSITVCVHRNSLQCCKMALRRGKRGKKKNQSYTMNPQAAKLNAVRGASSTKRRVGTGPRYIYAHNVLTAENVQYYHHHLIRKSTTDY